MLETWRLSMIVDSSTGAGQNTKSLTVPSRKSWRVLWAWATVVSDATVGNRQVVLEVQDTAANVIYQKRAGAVQAASLTRYYLFAPGAADLTAVRDTDWLSSPITALYLPEGYIVRIYDEANIDSTDEVANSDVDDLEVRMMVEVKGERRRLVSAANEEPSS